MRIGVVSDTHSKFLPLQMMEDFKKVDLIICAGDMCTMGDLKQFQALTKVEVVAGNMDNEQLRKLYPVKSLLKVEGRVLGLCHGEGFAKKILDFVKKTFADEKVDAVIFGHSHNPFNEMIDGVLYFNPGSPTDTICAPYRSYGILEVTPEKINGRIIKIES